MKLHTEDYQPTANQPGSRQPRAALFSSERLLAAGSRALGCWLVVFFLKFPLGAQEAARTFTHADTLRGTNGPQRSWWDVDFYDLHVKANPVDSSISGYNAITYRVVKPASEMQIDLQMPLVVDSIVQDGRALSSRRDGNAFFVSLVAPQPARTLKTISVYYHGKPVVAVRPPWDG